MIEKMKGKCLPLRNLTAEQIEKVKEVLKDKDCILFESIELGSVFVIAVTENANKIGVFTQLSNTPITFSEFLEIFEPFNPKRGDKVLVSDDKVKWVPKIFLTEIKGAEFPIMTVSGSSEDKFINNEIFNAYMFKFMKPYISQKLTKQEICDKFGIDDFEIV